MSLVQKNHGRVSSGACAVVFPGNTTLHNGLAVIVTFESDTETVSTIVFSGGGTFVACSPIKSSGVSSLSQVIYYLKDCPVGNTVTVTPVGGAATNVIITEWSGWDLTAPFGQHNEATGTGVTAADSGNITTTTANEVLFGAICSNRSITAGSGYTINESDAFNIFNIEEDKSAGGAGNTYSADGTLGSSGTYVANIATFKLAGGGGGGTPSRALTMMGVG